MSITRRKKKKMWKKIRFLTMIVLFQIQDYSSLMFHRCGSTHWLFRFDKTHFPNEWWYRELTYCVHSRQAVGTPTGSCRELSMLYLNIRCAKNNKPMCKYRLSCCFIKNLYDLDLVSPCNGMSPQMQFIVLRLYLSFYCTYTKCYICTRTVNKNHRLS